MIENAAFALMVSQFPTIDPGLVAFTRPLTMIKLISFMIAVPSLGVGVIKILIDWIKAKRAAGK